MRLRHCPWARLLLATWTTITASAPTSDADYIIVGAGTSGLLLANRLSSDPAVRVVVVEAGPDERANPNVTAPLSWQRNLGSSVDWAYATAPQPGAGGRALESHGGRLVGGTSMINGMVYLRGDAAQIDAWEALGARGWNWEALWPYYKRVERFVPPTPAQARAGADYVPDFHGDAGSLRVGYLFELLNGTFYRTVAQTWEAMGYPRTGDANGGSVRGFTVRPMMVDRDAGTRASAAKAFYYPVDGRPNLKLVRGVVTNVLWSGRQAGGWVASGVSYLNQDMESLPLTVPQDGEVILCAGGLRSPPILEASGIGSPARLRRLGIQVRVDLPGVGENLQDGPHMDIRYLGRGNFSGQTPYATFATARDIFGNQTESVARSTRASLKSWAEAIGSAGALSAANVEHIFRIQHDLMFNKNVSVAELLTGSSHDKLSSSFWTLLPFSRGSVHLHSLDPDDANRPDIDPRILQVDFDLQAQIAIGRTVQDFWSREPARHLVERQLSPAEQDLPPDATDAQWASFVRETAALSAHPLGTAAMMARELGGVVDPELKVYGTRNVRVVDASVIPMQISGHLSSTLYAVAGRAADMIIAEGKSRSETATQPKSDAAAGTLGIQKSLWSIKDLG